MKLKYNKLKALRTLDPKKYEELVSVKDEPRTTLGCVSVMEYAKNHALMVKSNSKKGVKDEEEV